MLNDTQLHELRQTPLTGANKVRLAMSLLGVTQVQLAAAIGITQAYVSSIVNGAYSAIPLETTRAFAQYFGCTIEDLFPARQEMAS